MNEVDRIEGVLNSSAIDGIDDSRIINEATKLRNTYPLFSMYTFSQCNQKSLLIIVKIRL